MSEFPAPSQDRAPAVLVSIVSMRCDAYVVQCVRALLAGSYARFAIAIVENGGDAAFSSLRASLSEAGLLPGPAERSEQAGCSFLRHRGAEGRPDVILCDPHDNLGYAGGNNVVIEQSVFPDWDAIWVLNPDTIPEPDALSALVRRQREGGYGMVGSRLVFAALDRIQTWGGLDWNIWLGRGRYLGYLRPPSERPDVADVERRTVFVSGASMYVTRGYVEAVGPMDAAYFMFCEDLDWCLRGRGQRFGYAHDSVVRHVHGGASGASRIKSQRSLFSIYFAERNKVLLARKLLGARAPVVVALGLLGTAEHLLRGRSWRQFSTALRGWMAGVRGETGRLGF